MKNAVNFNNNIVSSEITRVDVPIMNFENEIWIYVNSNALDDVLVGVYMVSNYGRVFSKISNRLLEPRLSNGYLRCSLKTNSGKFVSIMVHKLVMLSFRYIQIPSLQVNHINGIKNDNKISNLEWTTPKENIAHAKKTKLIDISNEKHYKSFLSNGDYHYICKCLQDGMRARDISESMGFSRDHLDQIISDIVHGESHIDISSQYKIPIINRKLFTDEQVHIICRCYENKIYNYRDIMRIIGLNPSEYDLSKLKCFNESMRKILMRKFYKEISDNYNF